MGIKICKKCGKEFPSTIIIDGVFRNLHSRIHCFDCVPFNSRGSGKTAGKKKDYGVCLNCGEPLDRRNKKFCSVKCLHEYQYKEYVKKWKDGIISGITGDAWKETSVYIKRYLLEKYDYKCSKCGWAEINPFTGTLPLEIEHIDGDAMNNKEENLTLLCPNCHSLTRTYRGANKGNGTRDIKWLSRTGTTNAV